MRDTELSSTHVKGKNIILCCDGTGNEFFDRLDAGGSNSNVVKLYTALKIDNSQVGYYHPGVGTAGDPSAKGWVGKQWSVLMGLAFGHGFKDNVLDAYRYLMETFDDGDRIFLFGFSRGSYTVRALAGLLDSHGLLCKGNEGHLTYAWNAYVKQHDDRRRHSLKPNTRFKQTFSHKGFRIHFVGLWDTVSSVGWVNTPLRLYSVAQNPTIRTGRHAISIDERRCFYRDNLWMDADSSQLATMVTEHDPHPTQDLLQVWFAGVHSDVGGSYPQKESVLSDDALRWLLDEAAKAGAVTKPILAKVVLGEAVVFTGDVMIDAEMESLRPLYPKPTLSMVHRSLHGPWWLLELLPHRYYDMDDAEENWRTPLGMRRRIPSDSLIHYTAKERIGTDGYQPKNLVEGLAALHAVDISGQPEGSIFRYAPSNDPKPLLNQAPIRVAVMIAVSLLDAAVLAAGPAAILWWLLRRR